MASLAPIFAASTLLLSSLVAAQYTPENAPDKTQEGQSGTNKCALGTSSQDSTCQNAYINSVTDFCLWGPPEPGPQSTVGNTERIGVSWCLQSGYGTRVIPPGTISSAHFIITPHYVSVTGNGDFTKINIPSGDSGGEFDPHGADGLGNPIGSLVWSTSFNGEMQQINEWTSFMSSSNFCFKACVGPEAADFCQHIYDVLGCGFTIPGEFGPGFDNCAADAAEKPGVYGTSTFHQGDPATPAPHPAGPTSMCTSFATVSDGAPRSPLPGVKTVTVSSSAFPRSSTAAPSSIVALSSSAIPSSSSSSAYSSSLVSSSTAASATSSSASSRLSSIQATASRNTAVGAVASASQSATNSAAQRSGSLQSVGSILALGLITALFV